MLNESVPAKFVTAPGWILILREDESTRRKVRGQLHICCAGEKKLDTNFNGIARIKECSKDGLSCGFARASGTPRWFAEKLQDTISTFSAQKMQGDDRRFLLPDETNPAFVHPIGRA